jgi:cobalt-zinc-cadmium efflux system protein
LGHHHHHAPGKGWTLWVSLVATLAFTMIEAIAGFHAHSLALISDAGHNFTDTLALLLAAIGVYLQSRPADQYKTFGYQRAGVLTAFVNALTLVGISLFIFWEAAQRMLHPQGVDEGVMIWVAALALVLNGSIMWALHRGQKGDLNLRAAFVHMLGDALGAVAIIAGAVAIRYTGWLYIDPLLSIALAGLICYTAWDIIRESLNILLEGLPQGVDLDKVTGAMTGVAGVMDVHDLHIWSLGGSAHALCCHVLIDDMPPSESDRILKRVNEVVCGFGIHHTTIQFEHAPCILTEGCSMYHDHAHDHDFDHSHRGHTH